MFLFFRKTLEAKSKLYEKITHDSSIPGMFNIWFSLRKNMTFMYILLYMCVCIYINAKYQLINTLRATQSRELL